jgi:hypothetical protein
MGTPKDTIVRPMKELIEDESLALKWTNTAVVFRILSQLAADFIWFATSDASRDEKTGERMINVVPETAKLYSNLGEWNTIFLPFDIAYLSFINFAEGGNTKAIAQD